MEDATDPKIPCVRTMANGHREYCIANGNAECSGNALKLQFARRKSRNGRLSCVHVLHASEEETERARDRGRQPEYTNQCSISISTVKEDMQPCTPPKVSAPAQPAVSHASWRVAVYVPIHATSIIRCRMSPSIVRSYGALGLKKSICSSDIFRAPQVTSRLARALAWKGATHGGAT